MSGRLTFGDVVSGCAWLPLALTVWLFTPQRRVVVRVAHGHATTYEGFPFLAISDAPHLGMYREAYIAPFVANFALFGGVAWALSALWRSRRLLQHRALDWIIGVPVYLLGAFALFAMIVVAYSDWTFVWWIDKSDWQDVEGFVLPIP